MKNINEFFKRIGGIQAKEVALRSVMQATIKEFADVDIPLNSITIKTGVVTFKGISQGARSLLFIKKSRIIAQINEKQSAVIIHDIR